MKINKETSVYADILEMLLPFKDERKRILFLEGSNTLGDCAENFAKILQEEKIRFNTLFSLRDLSFEYIKGQIDFADCIVFQSTFSTKQSHALVEYIKSIRNRKTIIECYYSEPYLFCLPGDVPHIVYALKSYADNMEYWSLAKLDKIKKSTT